MIDTLNWAGAVGYIVGVIFGIIITYWIMKDKTSHNAPKEKQE